jgi:hypothetical protein
VNATELDEQRLHILREWRGAAQNFTGKGMIEAESAGMEHLPHWSKNNSAIDSAPVEKITDHRRFDRSHVNTDLVGPSGFNPYFRQTPSIGKTLLKVPVGDRISAMYRSNRHFFSVHRMPADRRYNLAIPFSGTTQQEGMIGFMNLSLLKISHQGSQSKLGLGHKHDPGGVLIQTVDNSRATSSRFRKILAPVQQPVYQGAAMVPAGRMHDHAGRFADDQKVLILKEDCEIDLLRDKRMGLGWEKNDRYCIAFPQTLASFHPLIVDQNFARVDQFRE